MEWELVRKVIETEKENFKRAYKCINKNTYIRTETVRKHLGVVISSLENIRNLVNTYKERFTDEHREQSFAAYWSLRDQLVRILSKYNIEQKIPHSIRESLAIDINILIPSPDPRRIIPIREEDIDSDCSDNEKEVTMTQTTVEFLNMASRLIPDFDGKPENMRSFLDALSLVNSLKDSHEALAVSLIRTKLKGNARNLIDGETTITDIMNTLKRRIKGESVEVISAKMLNIKQNNKSANTYCGEIESLSKSLESADKKEE